MDVDEALDVADRPGVYTSLEQWQARTALADEVRRLRGLHSPMVTEVEDSFGIVRRSRCGYDGHPWPCPSIGERA